MADITNATFMRRKGCAAFARHLHQDGDHTHRPEELAQACVLPVVKQTAAILTANTMRSTDDRRFGDPNSP